MKCPACSVDVVTDATFCHKCGAKLQSEKGSPSPEPTSDTATDKFRAGMQAAGDSAVDKESELWQGSYSAKAMYGSWLLAGALTIVLVIVGVIFPPALFPVLAIAALAWLALGGLYFYRRVAVNYSLTSQRFIHQWGIMVRTTDRIEVIEIDDVQFTQGIVERLLGVGTIRIASSDRSHPELVLKGIADVQRVSALIDDIRRKERRRRGIHIEQI